MNEPGPLRRALDTPWKVRGELARYLLLPVVRLQFALSGVRWRRGWRIYGLPILQRHRRSTMTFGNRLQLRSSRHSNPLGVSHPVVLTTWRAGAGLTVGEGFAMSGGAICASCEIAIGNDVTVGANTIIADSDFHPLNSLQRALNPQAGKVAPVRIEDNVFVGMNCIILKGVTIGTRSVVGAGSVVTRDIPANCIAGGNPARTIR
jgi:acetyltransferase-like isoleucine patch superfamily enzyme